jgi:hypothetical protein
VTPSMPPPGALDLGLRARAARYYALGRELHDRGAWAACADARRIACLMWHLADPNLEWGDLVHC